MVSGRKLDASRGAFTQPVIVFLLAAAFACSAWAQEQPDFSDTARLAEAQKSIDAGQWQQAASLAHGPSDQSADLDFLEGLALAKLQHWQESRHAFESGQRKAPHEARFLVELAGVDYKQDNFAAAKRELRAALRLNSKDAYALEFLGTIYFVEGNLETTLKHWNRIGKPRLRSVNVEPAPRLKAPLLNAAIGFNAPQVLTSDAVLTAEARLDNLGIYSRRRFALAPAANGSYDATLHLAERNRWGDSTLGGLLSVFSGTPYATIYPRYYNFRGSATNLTSLVRWDSEKRRAGAFFSTPLANDPALSLHIYCDARNENWNLSNTFFGGGLPLSDLNVRRIAGGVEVHSIVNGQWSWRTGLETSYRSFRNLEGHTSAVEKPFFTDGFSFDGWWRIDRSLLRLPERRFTLDSTAEARIGREFADGASAFGGLRGSLDAHWLPRAKGDDYETRVRIRAGDTFGQVRFDELFQLGIERDNDLWLRGHAGTFHGRKGAAPLGRRYSLANAELDKNVYANGFLTIKLGTFLDSGAIADSSGLFGSQRWLWDTGAQCKVRVLGSVTLVLSYGRDLRGGKNVFYATVLH
jgi:tetratricopeptide (TPR) repeat protein